MSILGSLDIGTKGLAASQLALNVLGQNVANANTEGYSRKRLELTAAIRSDTQFGEMGFGVEIVDVQRINDAFLETQIQKQLTEEGYYTAIDETLERVENIMTEPSDTGLNLIMDNFWTAWSDLNNNPEDPASREVVRSTALVLEDKFQTLAQQLENLRDAQDSDLEGKVAEINGIVREIYSLNGEVAVTEIKDNEANDSRDRRDVLVQKLSTLIDVEIIEDHLGRISITTAGNMLIGPENFIELELVRTDGVNRFGEEISEVGMRFANTKKEYVPRNGELKGMLDSRDEIVPKYQNALDELAAAIVTEVNALHTTGYNLSQNTGVAFFTENNLRADNLSVSAAIKESALNIAAASGGEIITVANDNLYTAPAAVTTSMQLLDRRPLPANPAVPATNVQQDSLQTRDTLLGRTLVEGPGNDYVVNYQSGKVTFFTSLGNPLEISFNYNDIGYPGPGDGSNALAIGQIQHALSMQTDETGKFTKTTGEFYSSLMGQLGIERNQAEAAKETRNFLVNQFKGRKEEISGVSLDEELADMIRFEHTYQASARFITTINTLLETLLNL